MLGVRCYTGFSVAETSGGCSLAAVRGAWLLTALTSPFAEHGSRAMWVSAVTVPRLWSTGLVVVAYGLSCSATCRIFPDQGSNPCLLHWQADSLPPSLQGSPVSGFLTALSEVMLTCWPLVTLGLVHRPSASSGGLLEVPALDLLYQQSPRGLWAHSCLGSPDRSCCLGVRGGLQCIVSPAEQAVGSHA